MSISCGHHGAQDPAPDWISPGRNDLVSMRESCGVGAAKERFLTVIDLDCMEPESRTTNTEKPGAEDSVTTGLLATTAKDSAIIGLASPEYLLSLENTRAFRPFASSGL